MQAIVTGKLDATSSGEAINFSPVYEVNFTSQSLFYVYVSKEVNAIRVLGVAPMNDMRLITFKRDWTNNATIYLGRFNIYLSYLTNSYVGLEISISVPDYRITFTGYVQNVQSSLQDYLKKIQIGKIS